MVDVVCPNCQNQDMTQDMENLQNLTCSKCGKFVLLPAKPSSNDVSALWDYLVQAGKHIKELEKNAKI